MYCFVHISVETENPELSEPPDVEVNTELGKDTVQVDYEIPTAIDNSNFTKVTLRRSDGLTGNIFPIGVTKILFTAVDPSDNTDEADLLVTVLGKVFVCLLENEFKPFSQLKLINFYISSTSFEGLIRES